MSSRDLLAVVDYGTGWLTRIHAAGGDVLTLSNLCHEMLSALVGAREDASVSMQLVERLQAQVREQAGTISRLEGLMRDDLFMAPDNT